MRNNLAKYPNYYAINRKAIAHIFNGVFLSSHHLSQSVDDLLPGNLPDTVQVPVDNVAEISLLKVLLQSVASPDLGGEDIDEPKLVKTGFAEETSKGLDSLRRGRGQVELDEAG